ncbi:hypothetical protein [Rubinisphaera sp.]|uniref:hypothetical protein n=1 Tax=Rubinisphaera sp. TaxID=2024857 RepID=UPI000C0E4B5F|nr:hypothetical protein [Rubinisphaera sp.]MBV08330.1 hypothetical protein [Rubinisphaera sp.]HCS52852.1 hypothetical protein [Planctomycetaceae bacterium]|tara:strand:- start:797 stop:1570 length:774 start_codon:yes stop_codon:yes gene_type:complete
MVSVIISYYDRYEIKDLHRLLADMKRYPAGLPFRLLIVVNSSGVVRPSLNSLPTSFDYEVIRRENRGYNIGAWEEGWRYQNDEAYLFMQHECRIVRSGWLKAFDQISQLPDVGLIGESLAQEWDQPWESIEEEIRYYEMHEHEIARKPIRDRVACYKHHLKSWQIDPLNNAGHLQSLVLYAKRKVLEEIDGFPIGNNYGEAIASEIGISKKVEAIGYQITQVHTKPFRYISHPQWTQNSNPTLWNMLVALQARFMNR